MPISNTKPFILTILKSVILRSINTTKDDLQAGTIGYNISEEHTLVPNYPAKLNPITIQQNVKFNRKTYYSIIKILCVP
jgi:hypothetical protein